MEATHVRDLTGWRGQAKLWKLSEPVTTHEWHGGPPSITEYVVTSAADVPFSGPETYVFHATAEGEPVNWLEVDGSFKGSLDHDRAIAGFCEAQTDDHG